MRDAAPIPGATRPPAPARPRGRLFRKYVALFVAVVSVALVANGLLEIFFSYREHEAALVRIQREQAEAAAAKIEQFIKEIENQLGWTTQLPWSTATLEQRRVDALRLLRQVPAITELAQLDPTGHEQLRVSRLAMDVVGSGADFSHDPKFTKVTTDNEILGDASHKVYYGPVYFRRESEPYMTLSLAGTSRAAGVSVAEVNLKFIWDVVSQIKVGEHGQAYVVDADGRLIAHPDISLVLRNTDLSGLPQVRAARGGAVAEETQFTRNMRGDSVLSAHAAIAPLGWIVFVELPRDEAYAPLYASIQRSGLLLLAGLLLAFLAGLALARRMVVPIEALREGAARIGGGDLGQRIAVATGDELEALADQFNDMAGRLKESYADLEKKVELRTRELSEALEQQTATAEVLRVISGSPGELAPVFETMLRNATRICEAKFGILYRYEDGAYHAVATQDVPPAFAELHQRPIAAGPQTGLGKLVAVKRTVHIVDIAAERGPIESDPLRVASIELGGVRTFMAVPMLKEGELIGAIVIYRQDVRPFTEKQIELVTSFASQAVIAIENVRLLNELRESLERQIATSEVLRVISSSPGELEPVFDAMLTNATRICEAKFAALYRYENDVFVSGATIGVPEAYRDYLKDRARQPVTLQRMVDTKQAVHVVDLAAEPPYLERNPDRVAVVELGGARTLLAVPMLKEQTLIGAITIYRQEVRPFTDKQIELVTSFANQAVIAIENVRLLNELRESLERQIATSEVLRVISSSPGELQPVFDAILANATRICEAQFGQLSRYDGDVFQHTAERDIPPAYAEHRRGRTLRLGPETSAAKAVRTKQAVQTADARTNKPYRDGDPDAVAIVELGGARAILSVPMLKDNEPIGVITVYRQEVRPFTDKQIELVASFANQAVIAIENERLLNELRESLDRQIATSEVLRVISSSPGALEPVFDTILANATRICEAEFGMFARYDGDLVRTDAMRGVPPAYEDHVRSRLRRLVPETALAKAKVTKLPVQHADCKANKPYLDRQADAVALVELGGARTIVAVPMLKDDEPIGAITICRQEVRPFTEKQIELVTSFARQAVIAIENVRLLNELRASLERQIAMSEVLRVISSSPGELQPVFDTMLEKAMRICEARFGTLWRRDEHGFEAVATVNLPPTYAKWVEGGSRRTPTLERMVRTKETVHVPDVAGEQAYRDREPARVAIVELGGVRTLLAVPMLKEGEVIGAISIYRSEMRPFTDKQIELITSFANQAVIAIENVRLLSELRARTTELARSVEELRALSEVSQAVNSTLELETLLQTIVAKAVQLSHTDAGAIYVFDDGRQEFELSATYGMDEALIAAIRHRHISATETVIGDAARTRAPVQVADLRETAQHSAMTELLLRAGYLALLVVPLLSPEGIVGALVVRRRATGAFAEGAIDLLQTFATQSVLAIQNARLFHEIEEKGRQLEVASRHKSQFLANMSHELRTPLNAILGYTELLIDGLYGELAQKARGVLERVQINGRHLLGLINDVLDLSKIEAGQLALAVEDYSLPALCKAVVATTEPLARAKGLALSATIDEGLPLGRGDERRLTQVLLNLVGNAIKFADKGAVEIAASAADGRFVIAVKDSGPGIAEADQARIFEEFQQVDNTDTRKKGGTGLGLAIAKRIMEMHGGTLTVESAPGQGSTFRMILPIRVAEGREAA